MRTRIFWVVAVFAALLSSTVSGQSLVGRNTNAVGPTPDGFYRGLPHYQDNEPHCDRNPLLPSNIICMANGYAGADDAIGDAWPRIFETQDNARTWLSRFAKGSAADDNSSTLSLGFGADPIMVCFPGGCAGFSIASNRAAGGGSGGGVYMALLPELNREVGFRHVDEAGPPRTVQIGTGGNFNGRCLFGRVTDLFHQRDGKGSGGDHVGNTRTGDQTGEPTTQNCGLAGTSLILTEHTHCQIDKKPSATGFVQH